MLANENFPLAVQNIFTEREIHKFLIFFTQAKLFSETGRKGNVKTLTT